MSIAQSNPDQLEIQRDELDVLGSMVPLCDSFIIELGCGNARLARSLVKRHPRTLVVGLEVDKVQHAKNLEDPQDRIHFLAGSAESNPFCDSCFDGALMLKSLHHVPLDSMDDALSEVARVLRPGGWFYVSEPIYGGALNDIVRLFNDEGVVRAAAQAAVDRALAQRTCWEQVGEHRFAQPVRYRDWEDFAQRMLYPSFADHGITTDIVSLVKAAFMPHLGPDGAFFVRPMHARLLRRRG